jgi:hypothetical protein
MQMAMVDLLPQLRIEFREAEEQNENPITWAVDGLLPLPPSFIHLRFYYSCGSRALLPPLFFKSSKCFSLYKYVQRWEKKLSFVSK